MAQYMANPNHVGGGANVACFLKYKDYDSYVGYDYDVNDLTKEQLTFYDAWDIRICGRVRKYF